MDPRAIEKAESRLRVAQKAILDIQNSHTLIDFSDNWYVVLAALKNVWTLLEQGSKSDATSRQWFGAKKRQRREDELLQYMFEARNDAEHGLEDVLKLQKSGGRSYGWFRGGVDIPVGTIITGIVFDHEMSPTGFRDKNGNTHILPGPVCREDWPAMARLTPIKSRDSREIPVPSCHKGIEILEVNPLTAANLTLDFLQNLTQESNKFCRP